tara:strand:+ start:140 stop:1099 length:960 start_codon:yes stop_codon:yes gene_type:complete
MILITGCAGFIGFHVANFFLDAGVKIIGIDNINDYYDVKHKYQRLKILNKRKNFKFFKLDLKKKNSFNKLKSFKTKINYIIHLAGQAGVRYSLKNPASYIKNNIEAYIYLVEYFKKQKNLKMILYASSSSIYGEEIKSKSRKINKMISVYAVSKKTLENISEVYHKIYGMNFIGMRFFTVYGPFGRPDMSIFKFFNNISKNKPIDVYNYGNHSRSFTYISDIVENINKILLYTKKRKAKNICKVINIGNPKSVNLNYVIALIGKYFNKKTKRKLLPLQTGDIVKTKAVMTKEIKEYNFTFKVNIKQGIHNFASWFFNEK